MAEKKGQDWLVMGVLALVVVAVVAALALAPGSPDGGQNGANKPPVASMTPLNATVVVGDDVDFSAADSRDPDGTLKGFAWDFGDGTTGTGAIVTHSYAITGALKVRLEVTDDKGAKNLTLTNIWVNLEQPVPAGLASWNQLTGSTTANVTFPVDPGAQKVTVNLQLNTSNPLGAHAVISVLDPNGAVVATVNQSLTPGSFPPAIQIVLGADNLTVEGQWSLKVEARQANSAQPTVTVGFQGSIKVEYKP